MEQGTKEWHDARCGKITASRLVDLLAKTKSGPSASRKNYIADLVTERMTDEPSDNGFVSREMQRGIELEPEARREYEFQTGNDVEQVGFVDHPSLRNAGASPDGLVGEDGDIEIKCPNTAAHIETLLSGKAPAKYYPQMQWVMECTGRQWCDYISYDPRLKDPALTLKIIRVWRDEEFLKEARREVESADREIDDTVSKLRDIAKGNTE